MSKHRNRLLFSLLLAAQVFIAGFLCYVFKQVFDNLRHANLAMEMILFLNCDRLPPGMASYKADRGKKLVQYFDEQGLLRQERFLDKNNTLVFRTYDGKKNITEEKRIPLKLLINNFGPDSQYAKKLKAEEKKRDEELIQNINNRIKEGKDLNTITADSATLLDSAARTNNIEAAKLLIGAGADVDARINNGPTPLMNALGHDDMVKFLIDAKAEVNFKSFYTDITPLMEAAARDKANEVKMLLDAGADVNTKAYDGGTALIRACYMGKTDTIKFLIDAGADASAAYNDGQTALMVAIGNKNTVAIKLLKQAGANR